VYWLKATTLPSILHRICQFLIAEDLRITVARETELGTLELKELSSLQIEEDVEKLNEEDYSNGLELTDDLIEKTLSDQTCSDSNIFDLGVFITYPYISFISIFIIKIKRKD